MMMHNDKVCRKFDLINDDCSLLETSSIVGDALNVAFDTSIGIGYREARFSVHVQLFLSCRNCFNMLDQ